MRAIAIFFPVRQACIQFGDSGAERDRVDGRPGLILHLLRAGWARLAAAVSSREDAS